MNETFKSAWVAALRSGEYPQSQGHLFDGRGYCCLGVACVVADIPVTETHDGNYRWSYQGYDLVLPPSVQSLAGLKEPSPAITVTDQQDYELIMSYSSPFFPLESLTPSSPPSFRLEALNDAGMPFDVIADLIEKYL